MLQYIYEETVEEEHDAHEAEEADQHAFEGEMADLKSEEQSILDTMADLEEEIAEKENAIELSHQDREKTELEVKNLERYIEKIKPGCDWIDENLDMRKENRAAEKKSLTEAMDAMKQTPAYKEWFVEAERERLGDCVDICMGDNPDEWDGTES